MWRKVQSDLLVARHPVKVMWKFTILDSGGPFAMMSGIFGKQTSHAGSWDSRMQRGRRTTQNSEEEDVSNNNISFILISAFHIVQMLWKTLAYCEQNFIPGRFQYLTPSNLQQRDEQSCCQQFIRQKMHRLRLILYLLLFEDRWMLTVNNIISITLISTFHIVVMLRKTSSYCESKFHSWPFPVASWKRPGENGQLSAG